MGIESWFLRLSEFTRDGLMLDADVPVQCGDKYKWLWFGYTDDTAEYGEIVQANGRDFFEFTFAGRLDPPMKVAVSIQRENAETIVELKQYNIPENEKSKVSYHLGCMQGWTFYLTNLKSHLEGGIDLRNRNIQLQRMINS